MTADEFEKFIEKKNKESQSEAKVDWNKEKKEWLKYLSDLHTDIEGFLSKYVKAKKINLKKYPVIIEEENIGEYRANAISIQIGNESVVLRPIGTMLIGSKGRVDIEGNGKTRKIVLVDSRLKSLKDLIKITITLPGENKPKPKAKSEKIDWSWRLQDPDSPGKFLELNEENFYACLMEVANG